MPAHIHAELMKHYAEDATNCVNPWGLWECRDDRHTAWRDLTGNPTWAPARQYRRKTPSVGMLQAALPKPVEVAYLVLPCTSPERVGLTVHLEFSGFVARDEWRQYFGQVFGK